MTAFRGPSILPRMSPGEQRDPKLGAVMLALHGNALVVPAHVSGTRYDPGVMRAFFRRHHAVVRFGPPIDLGKYYIPAGDKEAMARVSRRLLDRIRDLAPQGEQGAADDD